MPQDFHVIRCFACLVFQVHQVKKKPKWQCKMCGEKQSVRKVYGKGAGKDCRLLVQSLNMTAGQITDEDTELSSSNPLVEENEMSQMTETKLHLDNITKCPQPSSRWNRYCEEEPDEASIPDEVGCQGLEIPSEYVITERPSRFKRKKSQNRYNSNLPNKRSRQEGSRSDWDTLPESNQQESGLYPGCSSAKEPSWESHCSQDDVSQRKRNMNPSSRQANLSNLENDPITYCENYNHGQTTQKAEETVSVISKEEDQKQHCKGISIEFASRHDTTSVPKENSFQAGGSVNSKWAAFAEPASDTDVEDDFGEEESLDNVYSHRENSEVGELLENCDNSSGAFSTQQEVSKSENLNSDEMSSVSTFDFADTHESHHHSSRTSRQSDIKESYQNKKMECKGSFDHPDCCPISRTLQRDILSIQNSISSSAGSRCHMVSEIQPMVTDSACPCSGKAARALGSCDKSELVRQRFQIPDECLEDLPDDFDVW
nr:uncharacterized protein LOC129263363 [Lytechinus pictus]